VRATNSARPQCEKRRRGRVRHLCVLASAAILADAAAASIFDHPDTGECKIDPSAARRVELASEAADLLPRSSFYDTPEPLQKGRPGDLIRSQPARDLLLPPGTTAVRILYQSRSPQGGIVPASAVVLLPAGQPPTSGWPVIAWAHGTTGVARPCAPSLMRDVAYGWIELSTLVDMGYAVVAADYQGLGTATPHPYLDKVTNAADVIYSVPAARAAVKGLDTRWVVMGHSQGGLTAVGVAEIEHAAKDPTYLGSISIAAAWDAEKVFDRMAHAGADPLNNGYFGLVAEGLKAIDRNFTVDRMLTDAAIARLNEVRTHCVAATIAFMFDLPRESILKPNWKQDPAVQEFFRRDRVTGPIAGPMLVLASTDDESIPASTVDDNIARLCATGARLQYIRYSGVGLDHDGIERATMGMRLRWIRDRFSGVSAPSNCGATDFSGKPANN